MWRGVPILVPAVALAGCGLSPSVGSAATEYVVCTAPAVGCNFGAAMKAKPQDMTLSGDGSLYVKGISWRGWGSATAVGHGTAEADNCQPNCADGTYRAYPAMLVLTDPKPWHGKSAYSHMTESIGQIGSHESFTHGLLPSGSAQRSQAVTPPPTPGPVSTQATVSGTCVMGYVKDSNGDFTFDGPLISKPTSVKIGNTIYTAARAYQVRLTVTSQQTADVAGFAVVFYDANGQETGSDQQSVTSTLITSGQSLSWTEVAQADLAGSGTNGPASIPAGSVTCQLAQWYHA